MKKGTKYFLEGVGIMLVILVVWWIIWFGIITYFIPISASVGDLVNFTFGMLVGSFVPTAWWKYRLEHDTDYTGDN